MIVFAILLFSFMEFGHSDVLTDHFQITDMMNLLKFQDGTNMTLKCDSLLRCGIQTLERLSDAFSYNDKRRLCHVYTNCFNGIEDEFVTEHGWRTFYKRTNNKEIELGTREKITLSNDGIFGNATGNFRFLIRGYADAWILLYSDMLLIYDIKLGRGGGTWHSLIKTTEPKDSKHSFKKDLMSCREFRPFWVQWTEDEISVGTGTVFGENILMYMQVSDFSRRIDEVRIASQLVPLWWKIV